MSDAGPEMKGLGLRRTSLDVVLTFGRQFLAGLLQLGIVLMISRILGPEGAGVYGVAMLLPTLLAKLLNLGLATSNVFHVASGGFTLATIWACSRVVALAMGAAGLALGGIIVALLGEAAFPGVAPALLWVALLAYPFILMSGMVQSLFQGLQDFRAFNLVILQQPVAALGLLLLLWAAGWFQLGPVLLAVAASHALTLGVGLRLLRRRVPLTARGEPGYLGPALRYGWKAHLSVLSSYLNYRIDLFLVNLFAGPAAAGVYLIAVRLAEQLWMISQAVSVVMFPRLSGMQADEDGRRALTSLVARGVLWLTGAGALVVALVAGPLIGLLFGPAFAGAVLPLMLLLPGVVALACGRVLANDLAARGLVQLNLYLALLVLAVNTVLNLLLIPAFGILGAAAATSIAYLLNFLVRLWLQQRLTRVPWWHNLLPRAEDFARVARFRRAARRRG